MKKEHKRGYKKKPEELRKIALMSVKTILDSARDVFKEDRALADRYVAIARKTAMKVKLRIPPDLKRRFCRHCYKFIMPGVNCRVRTQRGKVVYYCMECNKFMRFPYKKKRI